jgi:sugar phosphate isomerase/epimerase
MVPVCSFWLSHRPDETLTEAIRCTRGVGGGLIRFHLTPVLEGARASWGARWHEMGEHARAVLAREAPRVADAGLLLAVENHQDFGSEELVTLAESLGDHVGIVLDTGNPFSVGEDPVDFARRAAPRIRHVHLKDYVAQFTPEGFRLVRCAIGAGAVPFPEIAEVLRAHPPLTASLEPGALEARHIRLFTREWWTGYPPRAAGELGAMLGRLQHRKLADAADYRTPWERGASGGEIVDYEMRQVSESIAYVKSLGWL